MPKTKPNNNENPIDIDGERKICKSLDVYISKIVIKLNPYTVKFVGNSDYNTFYRRLLSLGLSMLIPLMYKSYLYNNPHLGFFYTSVLYMIFVGVVYFFTFRILIWLALCLFFDSKTIKIDREKDFYNFIIEKNKSPEKFGILKGDDSNEDKK